MEPFISKICIFLSGFVFFITGLLGMTSDVPVVTLAIRACIAAALCFVLSRILFKIFIEFFAKDTMSADISQHTQQPNEVIHDGLIDNVTEKGE